MQYIQSFRRDQSQVSVDCKNQEIDSGKGKQASPPLLLEEIRYNSNYALICIHQDFNQQSQILVIVSKFELLLQEFQLFLPLYYQDKLFSFVFTSEKFSMILFQLELYIFCNRDIKSSQIESYLENSHPRENI